MGHSGRNPGKVKYNL